MTMTLDLRAVAVGLPAMLGQWQGRDVISGIRKARPAGSVIEVTALGLAGDGQADLSVHGGPDKAVYAYPADHWAWWQEAAGFTPSPSCFGENLTVAGATEAQLRIGDVFAWGDVELEISQPRGPCYKLGMLSGRADLPGLMNQSARSGWYFRVTRPGIAPLGGTLVRRATDPAEPCVEEAFIAARHPARAEAIASRVLASRKLSPQWRDDVMRRLRR